MTFRFMIDGPWRKPLIRRSFSLRLISGYHGVYLMKQTEFSEFYQEAFVTC